MKEYNGYRSWNGWNVALWISNSEPMYSWAYDLVQQYGKRKAARIMMRDIGDRGYTPDGAIYNRLSVYNALDGMND